MSGKILACVALCVRSAFGQAAATVTPAGLDTGYQIRYAANLLIGDSVVNMTNSGASSTVGYPISNGNLCANVYTYSPDEQLVTCCSCFVTPNGLMSLSTRGDLISNTLTPLVPTSVVIKILGTKGTTANSCNASLAGQTAGSEIVPGLVAWGTTIHPVPVVGSTATGTYAVTESSFTPATLSSAELFRMTALCGFIQANGSGYGICKSCRSGGLGAGKK